MVKLEASIRRTIHKLSKSVYLLYILVGVAFMNLIGYLSTGDINSVIIFSLLGMITYMYSKNMIIVLSVPVFLTAFISILTSNNNINQIEQFDNHEEDVNENNYEEPEDEEGEYNKMNKKKSKKNIHTKYKLDKEATEKNFYNDLSTSKDINDTDISHMTQHTEKLIQKQKKLKDTMNQLMPIANKTNEFMNSIDIDKLAGLIGNLKGF